MQFLFLKLQRVILLGPNNTVLKGLEMVNCLLNFLCLLHLDIWTIVGVGRVMFKYSYEPGLALRDCSKNSHSKRKHRKKSKKTSSSSWG